MFQEDTSMNAVQIENKYYTMVSGINVYVDYCRSRQETVKNHNHKISIGRATIFITDVERYEKY
jgi:hypothetical protein